MEISLQMLRTRLPPGGYRIDHDCGSERDQRKAAACAMPRHVHAIPLPCLGAVTTDDLLVRPHNDNPSTSRFTSAVVVASTVREASRLYGNQDSRSATDGTV